MDGGLILMTIREGQDYTIGVIIENVICCIQDMWVGCIYIVWSRGSTWSPTASDF